MARRLEANPSDAEDLVASALMQASAAWAGFDGRFPRSFLIRILRNDFLQRRRKAGARVETVELDPEEFSEEPWPQVDWALVRPCLDRELARLPEEARLCVVLCDVEEMSYEEAAAVLEILVSTLKSRLFRARRTLRNRLSIHFREMSS